MLMLRCDWRDGAASFFQPVSLDQAWWIKDKLQLNAKRVGNVRIDWKILVTNRSVESWIIMDNFNSWIMLQNHCCPGFGQFHTVLPNRILLSPGILCPLGATSPFGAAVMWLKSEWHQVTLLYGKLPAAQEIPLSYPIPSNYHCHWYSHYVSPLLGET